MWAVPIGYLGRRLQGPGRCMHFLTPRIFVTGVSQKKDPVNGIFEILQVGDPGGWCRRVLEHMFLQHTFLHPLLLFLLVLAHHTCQPCYPFCLPLGAFPNVSLQAHFPCYTSTGSHCRYETDQGADRCSVFRVLIRPPFRKYARGVRRRRSTHTSSLT